MEIDTEIPAKENIFDKNKVSEFIIDETLIKVGSDLIWLWVAIEPKHRQILHIDISFERTMVIVAERLIASLVDKYGKHPLYQQQTVAHGIHHKHVSFWTWITIYIPFMRKVLSKGQSNTSKIELQNALMTIFHAKERRNVN